MKAPFSYRHNFFNRILAVSFIGHIFLLCSGQLALQESRYAVNQAPSSMEVLIVEEPQVKKDETIKQEEVLTIKNPVVETVEIQERPKEIEKKEIQKPVYIPPIKGALAEAEPDVVRNESPVYPLLARENGWEGTVVLRVFVDKEGKPGQILVDKSSGCRILDQAAVRAVERWQFIPARLGAIALTSWVRIPIRFMLENKIEVFF